MMRGVKQIVRFNWPFYAVSVAAVVAATALSQSAFIVVGARGLLIGAATLAGYWILASLTAAWIVYDRSPLMRWGWIHRAIGIRPRTWINIHAGLDESTTALRTILPESRGRVFDIYDGREMNESSIRRARRLATNTVRPEAVDFRHLPVASGTTDAALLLMSAHELRSDEARGALFREIHRLLAPGGRAIVAEHLRSWASFAAFGPGFLHFHSRRTWQRSFEAARLALDSEFSITPFVHVFVLRRLP